MYLVYAEIHSVFFLFTYFKYFFSFRLYSPMSRVGYAVEYAWCTHKIVVSLKAFGPRNVQRKACICLEIIGGFNERSLFHFVNMFRLFL